MAENIVDITHTRGDTFVRNLHLANSVGTAINLTGATIVFTIRKDFTDASALVSSTAVIATPESGDAVVTVSAAAMKLALPLVGTYYYDFQLTDSLGVISTIVKGNFFNSYDVTF